MEEGGSRGRGERNRGIKLKSTSHRFPIYSAVPPSLLPLSSFISNSALWFGLAREEEKGGRNRGRLIKGRLSQRRFCSPSHHEDLANKGLEMKSTGNNQRNEKNMTFMVICVLFYYNLLKGDGFLGRIKEHSTLI